ncbi:deoxyribose-phosphate aldolase [Alicyclobacillus sp. SP_1]|uniref:deoxyribose-phosphate aldolase n=1 Tax=Alicyclobacillus sp. SP_1 TaxID=2942475 RepID=UPI0021582D8A|nr:deoxyribose-phosphate aldolase [Alicyclobacillus sp. SP_1]
MMVENDDVLKEREALEVEYAAGGIVVRGDQTPEVLMIEDQYGHISFPKGHLEAGETWEQAAIREVAEETGIQAQVLAPLGHVQYRLNRNNRSTMKTVRLFLMEPLDKELSPVAQMEEVQSAVFVPLSEALAAQQDRGYANWDFVLRKVDALLRLMPWIQEFRNSGKFDESVDPAAVLTDDLRRHLTDFLEVTFDEMRLVYPDILDQYERRVALISGDADASVSTAAAHALSQVPLNLPQTEELCRLVDYTLLSPDASFLEVLRLCSDAIRHNFYSVCISPRFVSLARQSLSRHLPLVCTVLGFPHGAGGSDELVFEASAAIARGAKELDMVAPFGDMREDDFRSLYTSVERLVHFVRSTKQEIVVKVILEASALSLDQIAKATLVAMAAGADFVKTSTGFHRGGATWLDVLTMYVLARPAGGKVKASGGIRTALAAARIVQFGASRIGTSSSLQLPGLGK